MSRTLATLAGGSRVLRCDNPDCDRHNPVLAKDNGIKCRCGSVTAIPIHFYPGSAIGGGTIQKDWERHWDEALVHGCETCGIVAQPNRSSNSVAEPAVAEPAVVSPPGSHSLAHKYYTVPATLNTRGDDYVLPVFPTADPDWLRGASVLIVSADGPELPEIDVPMTYLRDRGASVKVAGQDWIEKYREPAGHIVIAEWLSDSICVKADTYISQVRLEEFDAVFIPGGAWNPDMLRTDEAALKLVRDAHSRGLLVASICHGPQVLINAGFDAPAGQENFPTKDVHITGVTSIRRDLKNAGFVVHDADATVFDKRANLLTARDPKDLGPFCTELGKLLKQRITG